MPNETISVALPYRVKIQVDSEIESGGFANANEFLSNLVETYFERKRILGLVAEGLADKDLAQVDWTEMSAELEKHIEENHSAPVN